MNEMFNTEIQSVRDEIEELKEKVKELEQKDCINLDNIKKKIEKIETEFTQKVDTLQSFYVNQKIELAEIRQEVRGIAEIKEMLKEYQTENTKLIKKMLTYFVITICVSLLFLIGMNISEISQVFLNK